MTYSPVMGDLAAVSLDLGGWCLVEQRRGPGEGDYLTYKRNRAFDSDGVYPDENYAREIQQLRLGRQLSRRVIQKGNDF